MRIVIIGAGVLGSLYGARLAIAGHSVTVVARGKRLIDLQRGPVLIWNEADGVSEEAQIQAVSTLKPDDDFDLALIVVRADQIDGLLPQLAANRGVKAFLFLHNRASGSSALAQAVGPERLLLGFPGASGWLDGATVRYRLIAEQPTTLGEPDGSRSPRLRRITQVFKDAGFSVALNQRMDDWLKTHAMLVTAIAGAIYLADGSTIKLAASRERVRTMVRGVGQGFDLLTEAGVVIEPWKLALLFRLPLIVAQIYFRRFLAQPGSTLILARHALAAPGEMLKLVDELRAIVQLEPGQVPELVTLWAAVATAAVRNTSGQDRKGPDVFPMPASNPQLLASTPLLDYQHVAIEALVERRAWRSLVPYERIGAVYDFVRNEIDFGYNAGDELSASRVLADGIGQCNTKGILLMALLRAVGIPCRLHGFTIDKPLQKGAITGLAYRLAPQRIIHSWVEVNWQAKWVKLEGFILDAAYLRSLQRRFPGTKRFCGYGAATNNLSDPGVEWRGEDTFIQKEGIADDFGVFDSPDDFYAEHGSNLSGIKRWVYEHVIRHQMNRNVARIRAGGTAVPGTQQ